VKLKIKKGATVEFVAGADKGKKGPVLEVDPKGLRVKVQGVRVQTHYDRKEGLLKREGYIHYSNVKQLEAAKAQGKKAKASKSKSKE
jgi:large subunit ribosomal protein L24